MAKGLPARIHRLAGYAMACEVCAADDEIAPAEAEFLEALRVGLRVSPNDAQQIFAAAREQAGRPLPRRPGPPPPQHGADRRRDVHPARLRPRHGHRRPPLRAPRLLPRRSPTSPCASTRSRASCSRRSASRGSPASTSSTSSRPWSPSCPTPSIATGWRSTPCWPSRRTRCVVAGHPLHRPVPARVPDRGRRHGARRPRRPVVPVDDAPPDLIHPNGADRAPGPGHRRRRVDRGLAVATAPARPRRARRVLRRLAGQRAAAAHRRDLGSAPPRSLSAGGGLAGRTGSIGLALIGVALLGLIHHVRLATHTTTLVERALVDGLGRDYHDRIPPRAARRLRPDDAVAPAGRDLPGARRARSCASATSSTGAPAAGRSTSTSTGGPARRRPGPRCSSTSTAAPG